jgi:hypothetical protein
VVIPPVMPRKGRTTASGVVVGVQGKSGNQPEDQRIHKEEKSVTRDFRRNSLVLVQKIKPKA